MLKRIKSYQGFTIYEKTNASGSDYRFRVINPKFSTTEPVWEADNYQECVDWIKSDKEDAK
jgi:hypothetical protein